MPRILVTYYSRTGNTRNLVHDTVRLLEGSGYLVQVHEARLNKEVSSAGAAVRALFGLNMRVHDLVVQVAEFDVIAVCGPVWAFSVAPPVVSIAKQLGGRGGLKDKKVIPVITCEGAPGRAGKMLARVLTSLGARAHEPVVVSFKGSGAQDGLESAAQRLADALGAFADSAGLANPS